MTLYVSALNQRQEVRQFLCMLPDLETGFELLNSIRAQGDRLLSADLLEEGNKPTRLPVEVFDGTSFLLTLSGLERDWRASLARPFQSYVALDEQSRHWYGEQLASYEQRIIQVEQLMHDIRRMCQRAEDGQHAGDRRFVRCAHSMLACYESQLSKTHAIRRLLLAGYQSV